MSNQDCNKMPGIVEVMWLRATQVAPNLAGKFLAGISVALNLAEGTRLDVLPGATATCATAFENNGISETATLEFNTTGSVPHDNGVIWAARQANGQWWLIGARERNFPVVEVRESAGTPGGDPAVKSVKITHTALKAMIPVAV